MYFVNVNVVLNLTKKDVRPFQTDTKGMHSSSDVSSDWCNWQEVADQTC